MSSYLGQDPADLGVCLRRKEQKQWSTQETKQLSENLKIRSTKLVLFIHRPTANFVFFHKIGYFFPY